MRILLSTIQQIFMVNVKEEFVVFIICALNTSILYVSNSLAGNIFGVTFWSKIFIIQKCL